VEAWRQWVAIGYGKSKSRQNAREVCSTWPEPFPLSDKKSQQREALQKEILEHGRGSAWYRDDLWTLGGSDGRKSPLILISRISLVDRTLFDLGF